MARVSDWFRGFAERHTERHPRADWPALDEAPEFYAAWQGNFVLAGVEQDVADEASVRLVGEPPSYLGEHVPALLKVCRLIYRERAESGQGDAADSRESAERASKDCDDCGGLGLTLRYRRKSADHKAGPKITLYCRCPMGRWAEHNHRMKAPEVRKRIYDLMDHSFLWGYDYRQPARSATGDAADVAVAEVPRRNRCRMPDPSLPQGPDVILDGEGKPVALAPWHEGTGEPSPF